jgi:hypothetical protein
MSTIEMSLYTFDELSEEAKETARDWYREGEVFGDDVDYEHFETAAKILGIEFESREVKLMNGKSRYESDIKWTGFSSQGDGASFTGTYSPKHSSIAIREEFPTDETLHAIADALTAFHCRYVLLNGSRDWSAKITQSGNFVHSHTMSADVYDADGKDMDCALSDEFLDIMRDFANWIYRNLEAGYDYRMSDECVDENIRANEYEFDENGDRA